MKRRRNLILPLLVVVGMALLAENLLGRLPAIIFTVAFGGGFLLYLATTWRTQINPYKVIIPYLLTILFFIAHVYEEYITDFEGLVSDITGFHVLERDFLTVAAFIAPALWIAGAIFLLLRWAFGYYFLCAFFVTMAFAELSHFAFPYLEDGTFHYTSGMYTAALPLFPAGYGLYVMFREIRREKRKAAERK